MVSIGLLGCGNIGRVIAGSDAGIDIRALFDRIPEKAHELSRQSGAPAFAEFSSFIREDYNLVVEAASVEAVQEYAEEVLRCGKDLVVLSAGALADPDFRRQLIETARAQKRRIYVPSGAIAGLDSLKVGQIVGMDTLILRTTKNPASLNLKIKERKLIFQGKAHDCIREFPRNINVAVALSLAAGRDADVEIWVDPATDRNIHEVYARGRFGEITIKVSNVPSPDNPATSYLAALSILALLKNMESPLVIGT
ncbi:MAG: aspartate dehydrogenase [Methanomicrobiales archaeon]|nr:aspartate dehydrogenase [Methanomicrobiales archaeon]MDD1679573.1 aspartate dehydrogenase [Methanomicrobiales archaeon]